MSHQCHLSTSSSCYAKRMVVIIRCYALRLSLFPQSLTDNEHPLECMRDVLALVSSHYDVALVRPCLTVDGIPRSTKGDVHCINQVPSYDTYLITLRITVRRHPHDFLFRLQSYKLYAIFQYKISPNVFLGEILYYFTSAQSELFICYLQFSELMCAKAHIPLQHLYICRKANLRP